MAKWRPVDIRLWSDRKFLSLSDDGRMLWVYLLTSPFALPIPGVIVAGEMAIAEQLSWTVERLTKGFGEVLAKGLGVTRSGRLIWLPKALMYQPIQGPNHISAIVKCWDDVPDCVTKHEIWKTLKIACKGWSNLFAKGLPEPLGNPLGEPFHTVTVTVTGSVTVDPPVAPQGGQTDSPQFSAFNAKVDAVTAPMGEVLVEAESVIASGRRTRKAKRPVTEIPEGWSPRAAERKRAAELGVDVEHEAVQFRSHHAAKGSLFADWDQAFCTWVGNATRFARRHVVASTGSQAVLGNLLTDIARLEREEAEHK